MSGAGAKDRWVLIEQVTDQDGESNYPVEAWTTLDHAWMEKVPIGGSERFRSAQLSASIETRWRCQYRPDLDPDAIDVAKTRRLVFDGRIYDITYAVEIGRKRELELTTIAGAPVVAAVPVGSP